VSASIIPQKGAGPIASNSTTRMPVRTPLVMALRFRLNL
jgi:hypothetical protein